MSTLVINSHPLTLQDRRITELAPFEEGETLLQLLERHDVDLAQGDWVVAVGGYVVPNIMLGRTRPKHGQVIECRRQVGRDALRLVAFAVLTYYTAGAGATWLGSGAWASLGYAAVFMAGAALINRLLPPSRARVGGSLDQSTGSTYSLSGGRNRLRPYEPVGLLFGTTKVVPDYAAQPYSFFRLDDQFQSMRFSAGINCKAISSIKIGDTPIADFTDVVEMRAGFPTGNTVSIDWGNVDTVSGAVLDAATSPGAWVTRTSSPNTVRIEVDLQTQIYNMADDGSFSLVVVDVDAEYRLVGAGSWTAFPIDMDATSSGSSAPLRYTRSTGTLTAGQYEVRLRKVTANVATSRAQNVVEWLSLKSFQADNSVPAGLPQYGLRVKASGQLNGVIDQLNWIAEQQETPVWNGAAFVNQTTSNPGALILQFARGIYTPAGKLLAGMALPDAQIDIDALKAFTLHCASNGYTFDHWLDRPMTTLDVMEAIAAVGFGSISQHNGRLGVVWAAPGQPREAVVNMGNIKQGSFRVEYATRELADELEVSYFDSADSYRPKSVRLLAPGVTYPNQTATLAPPGVETEADAVRMGRIHMAQNLYQRKAISWEMDLEHLAFRRFSVIALSHDLTQWGYSGRVQGATNVSGTITLQLDDEVPANAVRHIALRIPGESGWRVFGVAAFSGVARSVVLSGAWPGGVPLPGDSSSNPAEDTLWIYDFKSEPGARLRVTSIEPVSDLRGARITAVPEPDEFWTYISSGAYTAPPAGPAREPLVVANLQVAQRRLDLNFANSTELSLTFDVSGPFKSAQVWCAPAGTPLQMIGMTEVARFGPFTVGNDGVFNIEVRPFDALGRPGTKVAVAYSVTLGQVVGSANLVDASWWRPGAAWQWRREDLPTGESAIVWGVGPRGNVEALWEVTAAGTSGAGPDGGWDSLDPNTPTWPKMLARIDPTAAYRFAVPVMRTVGSGPVYFGPNYQDAGHPTWTRVCTLNSSTAAVNPYFYSANLPAPNKWYLIVGYVFPAGSTGVAATAGGLFDMATGEKVDNTTSFCWAADAFNCGMRAFQYYAATGDKALFAKPTVELVDGTEGSWLSGLRGADGLGAVPIGWPPGKVGGAGDFVYTINTTAPGTPDLGEIYIEASRFYHPDGTLRTAGLQGTVLTGYGEGQVGRFFLAYTQTSKATRFGSLTFSGGSEPTNVFACRPSATSGWEAIDDSGATQAFTPLSTDCLLAALEAGTTTSGITAIVPFVGGAPGVNAVQLQLNVYNVNFAAEPDGVIDSGQSFGITPKVMIGTTDDTSNWTFSRAASDASITSTLVGAALTITAIGNSLDSGYVDLSATRSGYPTQTQRIWVGKAKRATPSAYVVSPGRFPSNIKSTSTPTTCVAGVRFDNNGFISKKDTGTGTTYTNWAGWYFPTGGTPGNSKWIRIVPRSQSGGTLAGATGAIQALTSSVLVTLTATAGQTADAECDYQLFADSVGLTTEATGTITLHAEST